MKKYFSALLILISILSLQSCKEEVDLIGEFQETAIVYGILDQSDSVHMIKINRAFIGPGNSLEIAGIADSNYFKNLVVTIEERVAGNLQRSWTLTDTLVDNKDENGIFYAPEQILYYFETSPSQPLLADAVYKLHIDVNNGQFEVTGETGIVSDLYSNMIQQTSRFKFASNPSEFAATSISVNSGNSYVVNTKVRTNYREWTGTSFVDKSFLWTLGEKETTPNSNLNFVATGETFYKLMRSACQNGDPAVDRRTFVSFDVEITGGAEELFNYILVNQPSSSLAQSKPTYTNLTATNDHPVIGIFSSRQTLRIKKLFVDPNSSYIRALDQKSTQELCIGAITGPYLFCSNHPQDNIAPLSYACQ